MGLLKAMLASGLVAGSVVAQGAVPAAATGSIPPVWEFRAATNPNDGDKGGISTVIQVSYRGRVEGGVAFDAAGERVRALNGANSYAPYICITVEVYRAPDEGPIDDATVCAGRDQVNEYNWSTDENLYTRVRLWVKDGGGNVLTDRWQVGGRT